jgi:hypothetical protein
VFAGARADSNPSDGKQPKAGTALSTPCIYCSPPTFCEKNKTQIWFFCKPNAQVSHHDDNVVADGRIVRQLQFLGLFDKKTKKFLQKNPEQTTHAAP